MQGLEGGRGPPADSGRNRTRREETSSGTFDRRAGDLYNERGHTYDRTQFAFPNCLLKPVARSALQLHSFGFQATTQKMQHTNILQLYEFFSSTLASI